MFHISRKQVAQQEICVVFCSRDSTSSDAQEIKTLSKSWSLCVLADLGGFPVEITKSVKCGIVLCFSSIREAIVGRFMVPGDTVQHIHARNNEKYNVDD